MSAAEPVKTQNAALPRAIERYFEIALYLLVLTGFGTIAATGGVGWLALSFAAAALLFRGYLIIQGRTFLLPENWTTIITLAYVGFYLVDYFLISGTFVNSTVHLVLFVMLVRLFSARRDRDHYFLAVISFLMVLAAAVLTVDSSFLLTFTFFMLLAVVTFVLMEMRRASAKATVQAHPLADHRAERRMAYSLAGTSPALVLLILLGAAVIFFILPRVSSGYLTAYAPGGEIMTGFSDRVQLDQIGEIQQSSAVLMHIQIDDDPHGKYDLKWRGVALSIFDGTAWYNPHEQRVIGPSGRGRFVLTDSRLALAQSGIHFIHYRVLMEPLSNNVFFLAPAARILEGNYRLISIDGGGAVYNLDAERPITSYEVTSDISQPNIALLRSSSESYPPEIQLDYLQLPHVDPRIVDLAQQATASADNSYDRAAAIERYLRTSFGYTLQLPGRVHKDPLAYFLFERKRGHCEYFASAMAVMLRVLRIPSRVVNGFRTGEFNDLTGQYVVRAANAHSWVEAYFPGYGWISFDPTPAAIMPVRSGWSRAALYVDALSSFWREWIVEYDVNHQSMLAGIARRNSMDWIQASRNWTSWCYDRMLDAARRTEDAVSESPVGWSLGGAAVVLVLLLMINGRQLWQMLRRLRLAAHPSKSPAAAATIWYERTTKTLARRGWRKSPAQTPEEFLNTIKDIRVRDSMATFTSYYESARFGNSAEDAGRLPELYEEVSTASKG